LGGCGHDEVLFYQLGGKVFNCGVFQLTNKPSRCNHAGAHWHGYIQIRQRSAPTVTNCL
jgi:hypothetical protein